jgi:hypothetical protein
VIRIIVHAPRARVTSLQPCSPAILSVAGLASGGALQHLKLMINPHMIACANVTCLSQFVQLRTLKIQTESFGLWTQEKSVFAPGGRLPALRRLEFDGSPVSNFFEFLASCTFNALEEVDTQSFELEAEDWRHLHVFLDAHLLQTFTFSGDQTEEQTLDILRHARANQLGVDSDEHGSASYASIMQAIPQATRIWVVDYRCNYENDFAELMREIVRSAAPLQAVLIRDRDDGPFHWIEDLHCDDVDYAGHRLVKVMQWARILANRGIRMLDEKRETLHDAVPIP